VLGEQAHGRAGDVDGRPRQLAPADRAGRRVRERQAAEQADRLLAGAELDDDVREVVEQARAPQAAQAALVELRHDDHVGVERAQRPAGLGRVGVEDVQVRHDDPQPGAVAAAAGTGAAPRPGRTTRTCAMTRPRATAVSRRRRHSAARTTSAYAGSSVSGSAPTSSTSAVPRSTPSARTTTRTARASATVQARTSRT
jgi:hypothetical protein